MACHRLSLLNCNLLCLPISFRFFAISGYLAATNFLKDKIRLKEIQNNNVARNILLYQKMMIHRYIRLTPILVIAMLMAQIVSSILSNVSVFELSFREDILCQKFVLQH